MILLLSIFAGAQTSPEAATGSVQYRNHVNPPLSGSSTPAPRKNFTIHDRNKISEMCRGLETDVDCEVIIQNCAGSEERESCVRSYMNQ